jgi:hypothetical protein
VKALLHNWRDVLIAGTFKSGSLASKRASRSKLGVRITGFVPGAFRTGATHERARSIGQPVSRSALLRLFVVRTSQLILSSIVALSKSAEGAKGQTPSGLLHTPRLGCVVVAPSYRSCGAGHLGASRLLAVSMGWPCPISVTFHLATIARPCSES